MDIEVFIDDHEVLILEGPYVAKGSATADALTFAKELISKLDKMKEFATNKLLSLYNEVWTQGKLISSSDFESNLTSPEIVIYDEEGAATVYFADSGMFGGHSIVVSVSNGVIDNAEIRG